MSYGRTANPNSVPTLDVPRDLGRESVMQRSHRLITCFVLICVFVSLFDFLHDCSLAITYKVVIKTGKQLGGSTTTAQSWMTLAGSIADTGVMNIPKNENEFRFQVRNSLTNYFCVNFGTKQGEKTAIATQGLNLLTENCMDYARE